MSRVVGQKRKLEESSHTVEDVANNLKEKNNNKRELLLIEVGYLMFQYNRIMNISSTDITILRKAEAMESIHAIQNFITTINQALNDYK